MARLVAEVHFTVLPAVLTASTAVSPSSNLTETSVGGGGRPGPSSSAAGSALSEPPLAAESAWALWVSAWRVGAASSSSARSLLSLRTAVRKLRYASAGVSSGER